MSQAFYSAIGGMAAGQTKVNVVADNVANMNTVGFKASSVNFSDVYYRTSSTGQAPSGRMGGVNPKQIGIGVQTASLTRDFSAGTTLTTGKATDLSIQGSSFFTVASPTVEILYTRAGNFTVDANGNLVLPNGYKAIGTDRLLQTTSSTTPIKIPTLVNTVTNASESAHMDTKKLVEMNGAEIATGSFSVTYEDSTSTAQTQVFVITADTTMAQLKADLATVPGFTVSTANGKLSIDVDETQATNVKFENGDVTNPSAEKSNFVTIANLQNISTAGNPPLFETDAIDFQQTISAGTSNINTAQNFTSVTISENGIIEVKYGNNDTLSVMRDPNNPGRMIYKYALNNGIIITGDDVTVKDNVVEPANLQLQMASMVNPNGLTGVGNNAYSTGPNVGMILFGSISSDAFGSVKSGILEGSNVDLSSQFADMIVAQRAIEANSRVFDTSNQILKTLSYLGQS
jgi:flagellar hook protein FlgE